MRLSFAAALVLLFSFAISLSPLSWAAPVEPADKPAKEEPLAPPPPEEVLRRIEAPAVAPVIKTKGGIHGNAGPVAASAQCLVP